MTAQEFETIWMPRALSILRIVTAVLFIEHGTQKLLGFPPPLNPGQTLSSLFLVQGLLETFGGLALLLGFYTRPVAFILAGNMAVAYFMAHAPRNFFPSLNGGDSAIQFCFVFLFFVVAGGGAWSLDRMLKNKWA